MRWQKDLNELTLRMLLLPGLTVRIGIPKLEIGQATVPPRYHVKLKNMATEVIRTSQATF